MRNQVVRALLAFLFLHSISVLPGFAQSKSDSSKYVYVITPVIQTLNISNTGYYLAEVIDARGNKTNNGYLQDTVKHRLVFLDSLPAYIFSFVFPQSPTDAGLGKPVSMQIEKMRCFSSTDGKIDEGKIYLKVGFYEHKSIGGKLVHSFEHTFNYRKKNQVDFIANLIRNAFKNAFSGLKNTNPESLSPIKPSQPSNSSRVEFNQVQATNSYTIPLPRDKTNWNHPRYYLSDVEDRRTYNKNEGGVVAGFFNRRSAARLDSSLKYYLTRAFESPVEKGKKPLHLIVNTFRCNEEFTSSGEQGNLTFSSYLTFDSANTQYVLFSKVVSIDSTNETDITPYWPSIIKKSLEDYFQGFNTSSFIPIPLETDTKPSDEIVVESFNYKKKYFWKGNEMLKMSDFDQAFYENQNFESKQIFQNAKTSIRVGRTFMYTGGGFVCYALLDFLAMKDQSIINWYKAEPENSKSWMIVDKKLFLWGGASLFVSGFVCKAIGKDLLSKAIGLHNQNVFEKMSFNFSPDFQNHGYLFQLNLQLGHLH